MIVGLQITKNEKKYINLISLIDKSKLKNISFIHIKDDQSLIKEFKNLDVLLTYQIKPEVFKYHSNKLKWIHIGASGVEENLFDEILKSKIMITNAKGINSKPVSEFIMSQIMFFAKNFDDCSQFKKNRNWNQWELAKKTTQLSNSTLGIIGYGEIGKELSKLAKSFGMRVLATRRLQKKREPKKYVDLLMPINEVDEIFEKCDYLSISCPLTPLTNNLINKNSFRKMKKNIVLINTSRGKIINEKDLIQVLKNKDIKGAALDVFSIEPLSKNSPLFSMDNVFLSPHISGNFKEYQEIMIKQFNEMLIKFMNGKPIKNRVCKKRLY